MSRFKVGDMIRVFQYAGNDSKNHDYFRIGDIGTILGVNISGISGPNMLRVDFNNPSNEYITGVGKWYVYNQDSVELFNDFKIDFDISTLDEDALIPEELYLKTS